MIPPEFFPHPQHSHIYLSEDGRVWSVTKNRECRTSRLNSQVNYQRLCTKIDGKTKNFYLHRLVAETFIPNPHNYSDINHINGDKTDNCVNNLEWVSKSMNLLHCARVLENNPLVGTYLLEEVSTGRRIVVKNLTKFCEDNGLNYSSIRDKRNKSKTHKIIERLS
jgi:hypothetical protein